MLTDFFWTKARKEDQQQLAEPQAQPPERKGPLWRRMSQPSDVPRLTPQFCFNQKALQCEISLLTAREHSSNLAEDGGRI